MKKKVGELYDKPIVIGNPNEFTKNELPLNELKQGKNQYLYFSVDYDNFNSFLSNGGSTILFLNYFKILDTYEGASDIYYKSSSFDFNDPNVKIIGACLIPNFRSTPDKTTMDEVNERLNIDGFTSITDIPGVTPITEEEFYTT